METRLPLIAGALVPWAVATVAALLTPRLTRPDLFFAVTVKPSFRDSDAGGRILREYYLLVVIAALLALLPLGFVRFAPPLMLLGLLGPVTVEIVGCFAAFLLARSRTMPHHVEPSAQREAAVEPREVSLPGGWMAQAGPFVILAVVGICLAMNWDRIPARIPIHWGMGGTPNGWAAKSPASVFGGTVIGLLTCLLLAGLCYGIVYGVRRINSTGQAALREARFVRAISFFLLAMEYWLALLMGMFSLLALRSDPHAPLPVFWPVVLVETLVIGAVFVIACRMGQGGWRLKSNGENGSSNADAAPVGDRTPDACWKLGVLYVNRNDPALFVEKRFGVGWTLNFGNPKSWLVLGGLISFAVVSVSFSLIMAHQGSR